MSEFIVMAATLIDIKCRMLLPKEVNDEGEEEDPRAELVEKLLEYKMYKYMAYELKDRYVDAGKSVFKEPTLPKEVEEYRVPLDYDDLLRNVNLMKLTEIYNGILKRAEDRIDPIRSKFGNITKDEVSLEGKQTQQKNVVSTLQKQQKEIQGIIAQQKKKDAALNAQIDRLIAEEVARQKARAAAEAKRKAEAEAAKKRAAELARKKAEAEKAAKENARRIAEAKAKEEKAKAEARAARNKKARELAERQAKEAEEARIAAERRAEKESREHAKEVAEAKKSAEAADYTMSSEDRRLSGNFESNRGVLPMPITGSYRIVSHFGQYNVEGLSNVTLDNKGINIKGQPGAYARSIFDGEVSAVFSFGGTMVVMVRHGSYISVYCNLASVSVHKGQKVSTRQTLGKVGQDDILQFQLRRETAKLNPESWLGR
jgi:septal ring factor EnvC (AmiA/AmiB activator)